MFVTSEIFNQYSKHKVLNSARLKELGVDPETEIRQAAIQSTVTKEIKKRKKDLDTIYYKKTKSTIKELQEEKEKQVKDYKSEFKEETKTLKEEINKKVDDNNKVSEENQALKDKIQNLTDEAKQIELNLSVVHTSLEAKEKALNNEVKRNKILEDQVDALMEKINDSIALQQKTYTEVDQIKNKNDKINEYIQDTNDLVLREKLNKKYKFIVGEEIDMDENFDLISNLSNTKKQKFMS